MNILNLPFTAIILWFPILGSGQNAGTPAIIPPSPNAAAFAKYSNIPVSAYTGVANVEIPLYTIEARDIKVPISLTYHGSGIKAAEEASRVGLGFVLNCGGVISRNIVGKDDFLEDPQGYLNSLNNSPVLPLGPEYAHKLGWQQGTEIEYYNVSADPNAPTVQHLQLQDYVYGSDYDYQPDQFNFNFLGFSGKFAMTRDRIAVIEKNEKMKIAPSADGSSWDVMTADGFMYKFEASEYFVDYNNTAGYQQKSAWYLTKIISPQGEEVTFQYQTTPEEYVKPVGTYHEMISPVVLSCVGFACTPLPASPPASTPGKYYSNIYLSSVVWDRGSIQLQYLDDRLDLDGDRRLVSMKIFKDAELQPYQEIVFNQDYFTSPDVGNKFAVDVQSVDNLYKRLKLLSVIKRPIPDISHESEKYSFNYYEGDDYLPPKNSFAVDHWGFYNGRTANQSFIPSYQYVADANSYDEIIGIMGNEREPVGNFARGFSLKEIIYPTGGKSNFYYENNDYEVTSASGGGGSSTAVPCEIPTQLFYPASQKGTIFEFPLDLRDEYVDQDGKTIPVQLDAAFRSTGACKDVQGNPQAYFELYYKNGGRISLVDFGLMRCSQSNETLCIYCDDSEFSQSPVFTYKNSYILPPGEYTWKAYIASSEVNIQDIIATYRWWAKPLRCGATNTTNNHYALAGGLRVSRIEDYEPESGVVTNVKKYNYHYEEVIDDVTHVHSYGKRMVEPMYSYFEVAAEEKNSAGSSEICLDCVHLVRTSESNTPPFNSQGYAVGYDKVIETIGENGQAGNVVYEYENQPDEVLLNHYSNGALAKPSVFAVKPYVKNGMLKRQSFNEGNTVMKEIINEYDIKKGKIVYGLEKMQLRRVNMVSGGAADVLLLVYPAVESNFVYLSKSYERHYSYGPETIAEFTTEYFYDNPVHLQLSKMKTEKSGGHFIIKEYKYAADFLDGEATSPVLAMKGEKHMHSLPIEITTKDQAPDGTEKVTDRELNIYQFFNTKIFPQEKVRLKTTTPLATIDVPSYVPSAGYDQELYEKLYTLDYDGEGNIVSVQKNADVPVDYIWGYGGDLPIAEVYNSNVGDSFHTSFESDGDTFQNGSGLSLARTGNRVLTSSTFTFPAAFTPVEVNTIMSYWFWDGTRWVFSGVVPFQHTISVSGTKLDEIRAYPKNARMRTFTYVPAFGITSVTDENSISQFFEYDNMGRLKETKDNDGNLLKTYSYHYKE